MIYTVFLDNKKIGTSLLEKGDAAMGVVFGKLISDNELLCYDFISKYCKDNGIDTTEYPEDKLITTRSLPGLKIVNEKGVEIKGLSSNLKGMDSEGFEVNIECIPYPFYEEEFPHHKKAYDDQLG
jgi:hypothetical protein